MSPPILSSPMYTLPLIQSLLSSPNHPSLDQRIKLLSAKAHLLSTSLPGPTPDVKGSVSQPVVKDGSVTSVNAADTFTNSDWLELQQTRLELGKIYAHEKGDMTLGEVEIGMVQSECKGFLNNFSKNQQHGGVEGGNPQERRKANVRRKATEQVRELRIEAIQELVQINSTLGKEARARTWRKLLDDLNENVDR
ncbi:hypothetical protein L204_105837 [Cryptococcus depauperatus]|nr:hypothetical protein L204_06108 [Cryptococcus depauperatus CBS 7855]